MTRPTRARPARASPLSRRHLLATAAAGLVVAGPAWADTYPSRPIRVIIATGAGSVSDLVARLLARYMVPLLGQPWVVEDIAAAGGLTGTETLVRSPKDGYTLAAINNNHVINPTIFKNMPFDTLTGITPISVIGDTPLVLVVNPNVPAKSLPELLALARNDPGKLTFGSPGNGTTLYLAGFLLTSEGKVDIRHIPYRSTGQMMTDTLAGTVDMAFVGVAGATELIASGALRPIGVTTTYRAAVLPDVPTFAEQGLPNYDFAGWIMLAGPAGLPRPIVDRLNGALRAALGLPEVKDAFAKLGVAAKPDTPEEATRFLANELDKHVALAKRSGATLD